MSVEIDHDTRSPPPSSMSPGIDDRADRSSVSPDKSDMIPSVRLTESSRVEAFSDAVMAIVITILVLEVRVPEHDPGRLLATLGNMWGSLLAFLISFLRVSVIWLNHHSLFLRVRRVDRKLFWLNLSVLLNCTLIPLPTARTAVGSGMSVQLSVLLNCTLIPLPTAVLADALQSGDPTDLRVAGVLYALLAALQAAAWIPIFPHLRDHPELVEPGADAALLHAQRIRPWIGVGLDAAAAVAALVSAAAMLVLWAFALIFLAVTSDGIERIPRVWRRRSQRRGRCTSRHRSHSSSRPTPRDDGCSPPDHASTGQARIEIPY